MEDWVHLFYRRIFTQIKRCDIVNMTILMKFGNNNWFLPSFVLFCLFYSLASHEAFSSYQVFISSPGPLYIVSTNSPQPIIYTLPDPYQPSSAYALAFAGFSFNIQLVIDFATYISPASSDNIQIEFWAFGDNTLFTMRYFLLVARPPQTGWIWLVNGSYYCSSVNNFATGTTTQYFEIPGVPSVINSSSQISTRLFLTHFHSQSFSPGSSIYTEMDVTGMAAPNRVRIKISRFSFSQKIIRVSYCLILFNMVTMNFYNVPRYFDLFVTHSAASGGTDLFFDNLPFNFGIPSFFITGILGGFDGNCVVAMDYLQIGVGSPNYERRSMLFDIDDLTNTLVQLYDPGMVAPPVYQEYRSQFQVFCLASCSIGTYFDSSSGCVNCPVQCISCYRSTYCTSCLISYYLSIANICVPCSASLVDCLTCSVNISVGEYNCTLCSPNYIINSNLQCESCGLLISNCLSCTNGSFCLACLNSSYGYFPSNNSCLLCRNQYPYCLQCTDQKCTLCQSGFYLRNHECICIVGNMVSGICVNVQGCIAAVQNSDGTKSCTACNTLSFKANPVNGECVCLEDIPLQNGICNDIQGCILPEIGTDGIVYCRFCNVGNKLHSVPDSSRRNCLCEDKYQMQNGICVDICGDGFLMTATVNACDDGNIQDGDGCSADCRVENSYRCQNGSSTSPSACVYAGVPLTLSLKYIERSEGLNRGVFEFSIYPPLLNINRMDLSKYVSLSCASTYTVSSMDYSSGTLTLTADYSEDMEERDCVLTIAYNSSIILSPNSTLSFSAVSRTSPLIVSSNLSIFANFKLIFTFLGYVCLILFFLSFLHKLMGAELLTCCQLVYLSHCFYQIPSFLFTSIKSFNPVTGLWMLYYQKIDRQLLFPFTDRIQITAFFIRTSLIVICILCGSGLIWCILIIVKKNVARMREYYVQPNDSFSRLNKAIILLYKCLIFPMIAGFSVVLSISAYINNRRLLAYQFDKFESKINSLSLLFVWVLMGVVACIEVNSFQQYKHLRGQVGVKYWYVPLFLVRSILISLLILQGIPVSLNKSLYSILLVEVLFSVLVLLGRAYSSVLHTIGVLICQFTVIYSLLLALVRHFITPSEAIEVFLIIVLEGLLLISMLFTLVRIIVNIIRVIRHNPQKNEEKSSIKVRQFQNSEERQMIQGLKASMLNNSKRGAQLIDRSSSISRAMLSKNSVSINGNQQLKQMKQNLKKSLIKYKNKYQTIQ